MNENRTYGIEIEFACSVNHDNVTDKINQAMMDEGLNHRAFCSNYYHHNTDINNLEAWDVKCDSSIQSPDIDANHPYGIEIASPVLKGTDGLKALKVITDVLADIAKVGKTTGLHVHHGVRANELVKISKSWMTVQDAIYSMVPPSRHNNRFCRKWNVGYVPDSGIKNWYKRNVGTRYVGLNLESFWIRGTVEFRCAAGSFDYEKISNWIVFTQMLIENAKKLIKDSDQTSFPFNSLMVSLKDTIQVSTTNVANTPKTGTKTRMVWDMAKGGFSRKEIVNQLRATYGDNDYRISSVIKSAQSTTAQTSLFPETNDLLNAINWAERRYKKFHSLAA